MHAGSTYRRKHTAHNPDVVTVDDILATDQATLIDFVLADGSTGRLGIHDFLEYYEAHHVVRESAHGSV